MVEDSHPRSSRGVSGDDPEGGAGSGVPWLRREPRRGRCGTRPGLTVRPRARRDADPAVAPAGDEA